MRKALLVSAVYGYVGPMPGMTGAITYVNCTVTIADTVGTGTAEDTTWIQFTERTIDDVWGKAHEKLLASTDYLALPEFAQDGVRAMAHIISHSAVPIQPH